MSIKLCNQLYRNVILYFHLDYWITINVLIHKLTILFSYSSKLSLINNNKRQLAAQRIYKKRIWHKNKVHILLNFIWCSCNTKITNFSLHIYFRLKKGGCITHKIVLVNYTCLTWHLLSMYFNTLKKQYFFKYFFQYFFWYPD